MIRTKVRHRFRRLLELVILFVSGWVVFCTWFVSGFPVLCTIDGSSMATTLLGRHVDATCANCRFAFSCDSRDLDEPAITACPNCAAKVSLPPSPQTLAGDRVLIDRTAFQVRRPRRWEVVAFDRNNSAKGTGDGQQLTVKRVVGLPGEQIQIIDGDVYADGMIQRKTLRQQRAMRILVHDDDYAGAAQRWQPAGAGSNWNRQSAGIAHAESNSDDIGWLVYNHANTANAETPATVTDYNFYNRGRLQRSETIHPTADLAMSFSIEEIHGRGLFWLRASDGRDEFIVEIQPGAEKYTVKRNRVALANASGALRGSLRGQTVEVSLFDRQFLFAVAGRTLATVPMDAAVPAKTADQPLAIGVQGLGMVVAHLRVFRDVYYTSAPLGAPRGRTSPGVLGTDEYFVLGDNSPVSEDSRTWAEGRFVSHRSLVGKPFVVIYPACDISLLNWHFQVPDLGRIRYIR
jgi:signal peptidase I